ncbi:MAG: lytic transglycosylase domain-containing protein [Bdellovibrio sp.]
MKTKHLKIGLALTTATLTSVLFMNFDFFSWSKQNLLPMDRVNEASRIAHAKELLGSAYNGSEAQRLEGTTSLNELIRDKVQKSLAPKWKAQADVIARTVITESAKHHLDPIFVLAVIKTESKFNPLAVGRHGEIGLMQIKPDTAEWIARKYKISWHGPRTLENPAVNIRLSLAYMTYLRQSFAHKAPKYVSAYNMGPKNVRRLLASNVRPGEYNSKVMKNYHDLYYRIATVSPGTFVAIR